VKEIEIKYKESRRRARLNWANSEHGKELSRNYMKGYRTLPYVKAKAHEYYVKNKAHWGEITKAKQRKEKNWGGIRQENEDIKRLHEEWARENGYRDNDLLHATNSERIIKDAKE
jgi:hypothetical protein|tara:strand:- start:2457 stop:2801 length:345 start_codon:yes stop_codon:yes gene_type:complete